MKKKVLAIALAVALIAVAVSGSIAYFTAEDQVNNTFTIGSVKIEVYENEQKTPLDTNPLGKLTPVVDANPKNDVSYMDKVVEVKNDSGSNRIEVRDGKIAVTEANCPDHHCINRGFCSGGVQIVCLPNRLVIKFVGEQTVDAVVG